MYVQLHESLKRIEVAEPMGVPGISDRTVGKPTKLKNKPLKIGHTGKSRKLKCNLQFAENRI